MNTLTHIIAAAAILAKPNETKRNWAIAAGALAPDISIYIFFACMMLFTELSMSQIWQEAYWTEPWQTIGAISNSVPFAAGAFFVGIWREWSLVTVFSSAMLIHAGLDFPLHADDAHRHFWPITDWRFQSPISYWDPRHGGRIGAFVEFVTFIAATGLLFKRFEARRVRLGLSFLAFAYVVLMLAVSFQDH